MKITAIIFFLLLSPIFLFAQSMKDDVFDIAWNALNKQPENYQSPLRSVDSIKIDTSDSMILSSWYQMLMIFHSYLTNYDSVIYYSSKRRAHFYKAQKITCDTDFVKDHTLVNAADYITDKSKNCQVVMINEAHHLPYDRAFVFSMLKRFYDNGYRYLALEALGDTALNQKAYPDHNTGIYTVEPIYGEMLREALKLHFKLIKYEPGIPCDHKGKDDMYCLRFRDSLMAVKLAGVIKQDPQAKMLVYAGYAHIYKKSNDGWKKMAQYFTEFTAIDPFCVELTSQIEYLSPQLEEKEFTAVNNLAHIKYPVIALQNNQPWHNQVTDATVLFPRYLVKGKRPSFYSLNGTKEFYSVNKFHPEHGQLIQAFYAGEKPGNRIPADQFVVENKDEGLYLFKGKYLVDVKDKNGALLREQAVVVN